MFSSKFVLIVGVLIQGFSSSTTIADQTWKVGVASVDITPSESLWMAGYASRDHPAEGILSRLFAKAIVLEDENGNRACLITADLVGISGDFSKLVCREIQARYQLDRQQVAICTSHTHTGPVVGENLDALHIMQLSDDQKIKVTNYTNMLRSKILNVVHSAVNNMQTASLSWGSGRCEFAVNRRENVETEVPALRTEGNLKGPQDHDVPVLAVRDLNGKLISIVFGYACHATVLSSYEWSGDYPGFAQSELEQLYPGCSAMFWAGCGADQNPIPRRKTELAKHYGRRLADSVDAVLTTSEMKPITSKLNTDYREISLKFAHVPDRSELETDSKSLDKYVAARARKYLNLLDEGNSVRADYPYPIGCWKLGDAVQFVLLGGEVVVDYAIRLKAEMTGIQTWVAGYSNDVMAYIPSRRVLTEGGYEGGGAMVYYGLPSAWTPDIEEKIVGNVLEMARRAKK